MYMSIVKDKLQLRSLHVCTDKAFSSKRLSLYKVVEYIARNVERSCDHDYDGIRIRGRGRGRGGGGEEGGEEGGEDGG